MKASPKRSYSVIENERFGLVFMKTGSIISGTVHWHRILPTAVPVTGNKNCSCAADSELDLAMSMGVKKCYERWLSCHFRSKCCRVLFRGGSAAIWEFSRKPNQKLLWAEKVPFQFKKRQILFKIRSRGGGGCCSFVPRPPGEKGEPCPASRIL